jgi:hypothetical protein
MIAQLGVECAAAARNDVHVHIVGGQRFRLVLHAGTAPEIAEDDRCYSHTLAEPRGA